MTQDNFNSAPVVASGFDVGLRNHMQRIYNRMTAGVLVTAVVAFVVGHNEALLNAIFGTPLKWVVMLAPLAVVMFGFNPVRMGSGALRVSFFVLSFLYGLSFGAIFAVYTDASIAKAFFIAASMFAGISIFGYTTKKNLDGLGTFAFMGMWGILALSLVNIFMHSSMLSNVISVASIVAFGGLTAWETQRMKEMYSERDNSEMASRMSWMAALNLYVSFIAMFQSVLHLLGNRN